MIFFTYLLIDVIHVSIIYLFIALKTTSRVESFAPIFNKI